MQFQEIVRTRYAAKSFDDRPISDVAIAELMDLIRLAPTSANIQPWRVKVVSDPETKAALLEAAWNQPQITSCSHLFVFCANTDLTALLDRLEERMLAAGTPKESVDAYIGAVRGFLDGMEEAARLGWAQRQTFIALGNGLNGAKALGFDACPMEGFAPDAFTKVLGLPDTLVPTVLMPIGYANDEPHPKLRFEIDEMFF